MRLLQFFGIFHDIFISSVPIFVFRFCTVAIESYMQIGYLLVVDEVEVVAAESIEHKNIHKIIFDICSSALV